MPKKHSSESDSKPLVNHWNIFSGLDESNPLRQLSDELCFEVYKNLDVESLLQLLQTSKKLYILLYENIRLLPYEFTLAKIALYTRHKELILSENIRNRTDISEQEAEKQAANYFLSTPINFSSDINVQKKLYSPHGVIVHRYKSLYREFEQVRYGNVIFTDNSSIQNEFIAHLEKQTNEILLNSKAKLELQQRYLLSYQSMCKETRLNELDEGFIIVNKGTEYSRIEQLINDINSNASLTVSSWRNLLHCDCDRLLAVGTLIGFYIIFAGLAAVSALIAAAVEIEEYNCHVIASSSGRTRVCDYGPFPTNYFYFVLMIAECSAGIIDLAITIAFLSYFVPKIVTQTINYLEADPLLILEQHQRAWQALTADEPSITSAYPMRIRTMADIVAALELRQTAIINNIRANLTSPLGVEDVLLGIKSALGELDAEIARDEPFHQRNLPPWDKAYQHPQLTHRASESLYTFFKRTQQITARRTYQVSINMHDNGCFTADELMDINEETALLNYNA